jgi:hypothetical protein
LILIHFFAGVRCKNRERHTNQHTTTQKSRKASGPDPSTFVGPHKGVDDMGIRSMTVRRFEELQRRLSEGRGLREIARAPGCSRDIVREVRDGVRMSLDAPKTLRGPLGMLQVDWPPLIHDLGLRHPLKFLWEERLSI